MTEFVSLSESVALPNFSANTKHYMMENGQQKRKCIFPFGLEKKKRSNRGKFDLSQTTNVFETQLKPHSRR